MNESKSPLDYATREEPRIEPWQPTRAAAIALVALGSCLLGLFAWIVWMTANGAFDD